MNEASHLTPFLLDFSAAFETSAGRSYGPWEFSPHDCLLTLCGVDIEPLGWTDMERLAGSDPEAVQWLAVLREDVAAGLARRAEHGSIWEPRR